MPSPVDHKLESGCMQAGEPSFHAASVLANDAVAAGTYRIRLAASPLAAAMLPGQFVMLRIADRSDAILGRAFAMWDRDQNDPPAWIEFIYIAKGRLTRPLAALKPGDTVELWGPLGNTFSTRPVDHLILVAGGVGQTPMLSVIHHALGKRGYGLTAAQGGYAQRVSLIYGARTATYLAAVDDFQSSGAAVHLCTEDGSAGMHGRVTDVLSQLLTTCEQETTRVACCGPEPMMAAVSRIAARHDVACEASLETPMACGIGICFSCVAKIGPTDAPESWDYRRTCVEGPIFDAATIRWD